MHIKFFRQTSHRVPHPQRPGISTVSYGFRPAGVSSLSHETGEYFADENGWIEVPHEVGVEMLRFRHAGSGYMVPDEVPDDPGPAHSPATKGRRR